MVAGVCAVLTMPGTQTAEKPQADTGAPAQSVAVGYAAKYKITTTKPGPDGTPLTTISTFVEMVDSHGRRKHSDTETTQSGETKTRFQVRDPVRHTISRWEVPGDQAMVVHAPDLGDPNDECAKKMQAIDALHPGISTQKPPIEDLGTKTFQGIQTHGGRVSFRPSLFRLGSVPVVRTNEVWTATDPALGGMMVHQESVTRAEADSREMEKTVRELTEFKPGDPDPSEFEVPSGRQITTKEGRAYYCNVQVQTAPAAPPPK